MAKGKHLIDTRDTPRTDISSATVKRLAWAFGCAKRDTKEESELYRALVAKVLESRHAR